MTSDADLHFVLRYTQLDAVSLNSVGRETSPQFYLLVIGHS